MPIRHMVIETVVHLAPLQIIEDLSAADAIRPPAPRMHSVAGLVGHMDFWQRWVLSRCRGEAIPMATHAVDGWPIVTAADWPGLRRRFEEGLLEAAAMGDEAGRLHEPLSPAIEFPPLAAYTRHDALVHIAQHNSHHLGQVVSARQVLELWPPRAGSWTW